MAGLDHKVFLVVLLASMSTMSFCRLFKVPPSYGDLVVDKDASNIILISLAPDGTEDENLLYSICGDHLISQGSVTEVICRQLGYEADSCNIVASPDSKQLKLYDTNCDDTAHSNNILRCRYSTIEAPCTKALYLNSADEKKRLRFDDGNNAYRGQLLFYPPDVSVDDIYQVSTGLVGVKNGVDENWRFIGLDDPLSEVEANTMCRHMGYTQVVPNSIMTKREALDVFNFTFDTWEAKIFATIDTSQLTCGDTSSQCLGCCQYPVLHKHPIPSLNKILSHILDNALVMRCTYFNQSGPIISGGYEDVCKIESDGKITKANNCPPSTVTMTRSKYIVTIATPVGVLAFVVIILFAVAVRLYIKQRGVGGGYVPVEDVPNPGPDSG